MPQDAQDYYELFELLLRVRPGFLQDLADSSISDDIPVEILQVLGFAPSPQS